VKRVEAKFLQVNSIQAILTPFTSSNFLLHYHRSCTKKILEEFFQVNGKQNPGNYSEGEEGADDPESTLSLAGRGSNHSKRRAKFYLATPLKARSLRS
jgi:hypothetical protein